LHIVEKVYTFNPWFIHRRDGMEKLGLLLLQKYNEALRMLAYGVETDAADEYCRTEESIAIEAMKRFTVAIKGCFCGDIATSSNSGGFAQAD
jgi:hypothetical protein